MGHNRGKTDGKRGAAHDVQNTLKSTEAHAHSAATGCNATWSRDAVTFRLTAERKRALRGLSNDDEAMLSPTASLDLAIELAAIGRAVETDPRQTVQSGQSETVLFASELRDAIRVFANATDEWASIRAQLSRVAADCSELRSAVASASMLADGVVVSDARSPLPLRAWLDAQANPETTWLVVKAQWIGKRPVDAGTAIWELEARELGRNGQGKALRNEPHRVELGPARSAGPLSRLDQDGGCVISCVRSGQGWTLSLRPALEGGKLGDNFTELEV